MGLSKPRSIYGVYSVTPYNPETGEFYGTAKVIGEASVNLSGELQKLMGGASPYPWDVQPGTISTEISLKLKEYPDWLFELFLGKAPTNVAADSAGSVTTLTNKKGASVMSGTTGIASVAVKAASKADLKFTKYVVVATDATHVDVYAGSDIDFNRGTDKVFENDDLKITASPLAISSGAPVDVPGFGLELTGGSGTIALVAGDTATFEVKPPSSKSMSVRVGGTQDTFPEFGLLIHAQQKNGQLVEIDVFRAKGIGAPLGFAEKAFSESEIKVEAFYDADKNGVFDLRYLEA